MNYAEALSLYCVINITSRTLLVLWLSCVCFVVVNCNDTEITFHSLYSLYSSWKKLAPSSASSLKGCEREHLRHYTSFDQKASQSWTFFRSPRQHTFPNQKSFNFPQHFSIIPRAWRHLYTCANTLIHFSFKSFLVARLAIRVPPKAFALVTSVYVCVSRKEASCYC